MDTILIFAEKVKVTQGTTDNYLFADNNKDYFINL